jgi:uncharacterized membrane protein
MNTIISMAKKYKQVLLISVLIVVLWLGRVAATSSPRMGYLVWNIFLAGVPLLIMDLYTSYAHKLSGTLLKLAKLKTALLWVLFLPNAYYLLTDFMHLNPEVLVNIRGDQAKYFFTYSRGDGQFVYDSLLLFLAAALGLYLGGLAMNRAYRYIKKNYDQKIAVCALLLAGAASPVAVYIGRFGRWNSWDALTQPWSVVSDFASMVSSHEGLSRFMPLYIAITVSEIVSFWYVQSICTSAKNSRK